MKAKIILAVASTVLSLFAVEIFLRIMFHLENKGILRPGFDAKVQVRADQNVSLGQMIRLSEDQEVIYELKPYLAVKYFGGTVRTNSYGFRSGEPAPDKNVFRIVGIGDSVMFGQGVSEGQCYMHLLQHALNGRGQQKNIEVLNAGVPGYNTVMEVESLKSKGLGFKPRLVIIESVSYSPKQSRESETDLRRSRILLA